MYIGEQEIEQIEGNIVIFTDGTKKPIPKAEEYLVTDEPMSVIDGIPVESQVEVKLQMFMLKKFVEVIQRLEVSKSFEGTQEERDDYGVVITTQMLQVMADYDFPISRIDKSFHALKSWLTGINTLMMNNLMNYERKSLVKAIGLESEGDSDDERLNNVKVSHYMKFLNQK